MTVEALSLPRRSRAEMHARRALGQGRAFTFDVDGEPATLQLRPAAGTPETTRTSVSWRCEHGNFLLDDAGAVLSLLGACPVIQAEGETPGAAWFWALYQEHMAAAVRDVFGRIAPATVASEEEDEGGFPAGNRAERGHAETIPLTVDVRRGEIQARGTLTLAPDTLCGVLKSPRWQTLAPPLPATLAMQWPLVLGILRLSLGELRGLRIGDVVMPESARFTPEGDGVIPLGRRRLPVKLAGDGSYLLITDERGEPMPPDHDETAETASMDYEREATRADATPPEGHASQTGHEAFDDLPLPLTVRCGSICMTLEELRQLGEGAIVSLSGVSPGAASLYHGERPLAHGELVSVDGELALQISRLELSG
ncbi:FliM/FliN family flagellar motor switch protein [Salinicola avicenniae]|uniref:FliM/FliN family flagellar motor switch protein n=1 Tax=Salinicola avicenniae TaxID=2916836 RepID=UPI0020742167|nr:MULTISPECIES: FliM/FliN family flagellar motor switch protein [unclassified Salinicola]